MSDDAELRHAATSAIRQAKAVSERVLGAIVILIDEDGGLYTASTKLPIELLQKILSIEADRVGRQEPATVRVNAKSGETVEVKKP